MQTDDIMQFVCLHVYLFLITFLITSSDTWTRDRGLRNVKFLWLSRRGSVGIDQRKGWSELTASVRPCESSTSTHKGKIKGLSVLLIPQNPHEYKTW